MADAFSYKITTESELFTFDFSQILTASEVISTSASSIIVMNGVDASPTSMISGAPVIVEKTVAQRLIGGVADVTYRLVMSITTSIGNTYVGVGDVTVLTAAEV